MKHNKGKVMKRQIKVKIFSRESIEKMLQSSDIPKNVAVISFYDTPMIEDDPYCVPVAYPKNIPVFYSQTDDIGGNDFEIRGMSAEIFFTDCDKMAKFVLECVSKGIDTFYCQCEFGQSRSSATAAAIAEFFNGNGIEIFADYKYCPNQVIYNKLLNSLTTQNFLKQIYG